MEQRTPDGRDIVVGGRRWRASDPSIPSSVHAELVAELMDARRAVGTATRAGDDDAEARARARVNDAKVALGERGEPWWDPPTQAGLRARLAAAMRTLLRHRAPDSSICPSDAARVAASEDAWRDAMPVARDVAFELSSSGQLMVTSRGTPVRTADDASGPLRISRGPSFRAGS